MLRNPCPLGLLFFFATQLWGQYVINTIAGGGAPQGVPATSVGIGTPAHLAVDANSNVYIGSQTQNQIYKVDTAGALTTVAGNGGLAPHYDTELGPALGTAIYPGSIALDPTGTLYVAGYYCCVLKVSNGLISRAAGNGIWGFSGDGGPASNAAINPPSGIAFDSAAIYI